MNTTNKILFSLICIFGATCSVFAQSKSARAEKSIVVFNDVLRQLDVSYVDTLPYEKMTETAINQMLRQVDPYTVYYPKDKDRELRMMTTGKYGGVGASVKNARTAQKQTRKIKRKPANTLSYPSRTRASLRRKPVCEPATAYWRLTVRRWPTKPYPK